MEGERVYDDLEMSVILQNENKLPCPNEVLESLWISSNPSPSNFHGDSYSCSTSIATTEDTKVENQTNMNIFPTVAKEENENIDDCDGSFYQPETKKRRLTSNQVHCLEKSFEIENKLEPDRKIQLAKEIGLQPRQVAIWFQNRRARFKTKQLEKDYGGLKASYDGLKCDYDSLVEVKEKLKAEVEMLKEKLLLKEKEITVPESTQPKTIAELQKQIPIFNSEKDPINLLPRCKQEDTSSANSDVLDSEQSDGEDELFAKSLFHTQLFFPKLEDACFVNPSEEEGYDGNWSFSAECQPSWLWPS